MNDRIRQAALGTDFAYFIFEQCFERFNQLEVHVLWQTAYVMVRFDCVCRCSTALDDICIERALC
ncbi:hypothetical protein D3C78_1738490 [compost metagenome]